MWALWHVGFPWSNFLQSSISNVFDSIINSLPSGVALFHITGPASTMLAYPKNLSLPITVISPSLHVQILLSRRRDIPPRRLLRSQQHGHASCPHLSICKTQPHSFHRSKHPRRTRGSTRPSANQNKPRHRDIQPSKSDTHESFEPGVLHVQRLTGYMSDTRLIMSSSNLAVSKEQGLTTSSYSVMYC